MDTIFSCCEEPDDYIEIPENQTVKDRIMVDVWDDVATLSIKIFLDLETTQSLVDKLQEEINIRKEAK